MDVKPVAALRGEACLKEKVRAAGLRAGEFVRDAENLACVRRDNDRLRVN
jgi:hypothetical protein